MKHTFILAICPVSLPPILSPMNVAELEWSDAVHEHMDKVGYGVRDIVFGGQSALETGVIYRKEIDFPETPTDTPQDPSQSSDNEPHHQ